MSGPQLPDMTVYSDNHQPDSTVMAGIQLEKAGGASTPTLTDNPSVTDAPKTEPWTVVHPVTNLDEGIVGWDSQDDPENPLNFSRTRKWCLLLLVSVATTISPLASSMFAPAAGYMGQDFDQQHQLVLAFTVSVFVLGYAVGPLIIAPLSEIYGRRIMLSITNWFFVLWQIGCALAPNIASLVVFRFLAGLGGSGPLTLVPGMIADLFPIEERGLAMSIWSFGPLMGPVLGPICGGFVGQQLGWRWVFWILLIASGLTALVLEITTTETCAPVLMRHKTARLRKELQLPDLQSCLDGGQTPTSVKQVLTSGLVRPLRLFVTSPIVFFFSTYMSFIYGLFYLLLTTLSSVFTSQYGFSTQISGLAYLGNGLGSLIGLAVTALTSDRIIKRLTARNNGQFEPEMRLLGMTFFACLIPISFFWYGWSVEEQAHWIVPIIGLVPFSIGSLSVFIAIQLYLVDCYTVYAASAVAALTALRSLVAGVLPLAGPSLYKDLGYGWGNSVLGFISLAAIAVSLYLTKNGQRIRKRSQGAF